MSKPVIFGGLGIYPDEDTAEAHRQAEASEKIRELNDAFRRDFPENGRRTITDGILAFEDEERAAILEKVRAFDAFTEANDPHGEHDFGAFDFKGERIFWKIDYYDRACEFGSDNPADPAQTTRVLTIMLADEY